NFAGERAHRDIAGRVRCGQILRAARADRFLDQVVLARLKRAGESGHLPRAAGGGGVLDAPAGDVHRAAAAVEDLNEVVLQRGAGVAATTIDLADNDGALRGTRGRDSK